jgi:nucleoside-diphosphate-sugar epimerase
MARVVSITGATGFLGWHLAEAFRDAGWRVRAVVRPGSSKPIPEGVDRREATLEADTLKRAFDDSDVVIHAAGVSRAPQASMFDAVNAAGTRAAVHAVNATGARLILISSQAAAGPGTLDRPSHEEDDPRPLTPYGRSKLAGEREVRDHARVPWTIIRPASVYGPRDRQFLPLFRLASRGLFFLVTHPEAALTLIFVDDVTRGVVLSASDDRSSGETLFLGHPDPERVTDLLRRLAEAFGRAYKPLRVPPLVLQGLALAGQLSWKAGRQPLIDASRLAELRAEGFVCSVDRATDVLGFTARVSLAEGARRTVKWYKDRGWV